MASVNCIIYLVRLFSISASMNLCFGKRIASPFNSLQRKDALAEPTVRVYVQLQTEPGCWAITDRTWGPREYLMKQLHFAGEETETRIKYSFVAE